jgi:DNA polymerase III subunit alpha
MLQRSETTAVFQLESRGMKDLIKTLKPDCFEDMIALVALFRPGPLQSGMVDNFIDRKHGREELAPTRISSGSTKASSRYWSRPTALSCIRNRLCRLPRYWPAIRWAARTCCAVPWVRKNPVEMAKQRGGFEDGAKARGIDGDLPVKSSTWWRNSPVMASTNPTPPPMPGVLPDAVAEGPLPGASLWRR